PRRTQQCRIEAPPADGSIIPGNGARLQAGAGAGLQQGSKVIVVARGGHRGNEGEILHDCSLRKLWIILSNLAHRACESRKPVKIRSPATGSRLAAPVKRAAVIQSITKG